MPGGNFITCGTDVHLDPDMKDVMGSNNDILYLEGQRPTWTGYDIQENTAEPLCYLRNLSLKKENHYFLLKWRSMFSTRYNYKPIFVSKIM